MNDPEIKVGDVVYTEGSSALLGDVVKVDEDGIEVHWRSAFSTEQAEDLIVERNGVSETFQRYIDNGDEAIKSFSDFPGIEYDTAASDVIASILHAVFDGDYSSEFYTPASLLDKALDCYEGDQEDR